jgi:C_GCAxxG_C_C family probable redox protein
MSVHSQKAEDYFYKGYNCAQSVFLAFCDVTGYGEEEAAKISSCLGGGMCRLRETCGAVSAIALVLGALYGNFSPDDIESKGKLYASFQSLAFEFKKRNGSFVCRELLGLDHLYDDPRPAPRTSDYYKKRKCAEYIASAAQILDEFIEKREKYK